MQTNRTTLKPDPARVRHIVDLAARKHALVRAAQDRVDDLQNSLNNKRRELDLFNYQDFQRQFGKDYVKTQQAKFDEAISNLKELLAEADSDLKRLADDWQASARLKGRVVEHARMIGILVHGEDNSGSWMQARSAANA